MSDTEWIRLRCSPLVAGCMYCPAATYLWALQYPTSSGLCALPAHTVYDCTEYIIRSRNLVLWFAPSAQKPAAPCITKMSSICRLPHWGPSTLEAATVAGCSALSGVNRLLHLVTTPSPSASLPCWVSRDDLEESSAFAVASEFGQGYHCAVVEGCRHGRMAGRWRPPRDTARGRVIGERRMRGEGRALPHCSSPVTCYYGTVLVSI
jgi:hypothetical protein